MLLRIYDENNATRFSCVLWNLLIKYIDVFWQERTNVLFFENFITMGQEAIFTKWTLIFLIF